MAKPKKRRGKVRSRRKVNPVRAAWDMARGFVLAFAICASLAGYWWVTR